MTSSQSASLLSLQFFKEANETYSNLQKEHESVRKRFPCDRDTSLENLLELLKALEVRQTSQHSGKQPATYCSHSNTSDQVLLPASEESFEHILTGPIVLCLQREKEKIMENKRQVKHLVSSSKNIVRLKPRNPEEKSNSIVIKALCDFKQDQVSCSSLCRKFEHRPKKLLAANRLSVSYI